MSAMIEAIDATLADAARQGIKLQRLMISGEAWKQFKVFVPRRDYRKRVGTRFINAYRGVPISIHDEWAFGWSTMPPIDRPTEQSAAA